MPTHPSPIVSARQVIETCGGLSALRRALVARGVRISVPALHKWAARNKIPAERALIVSEISGIPCHLMRPDVFPSWPGSANAA